MAPHHRSIRMIYNIILRCRFNNAIFSIFRCRSARMDTSSAVSLLVPERHALGRTIVHAIWKPLRVERLDSTYVSGVRSSANCWYRYHPCAVHHAAPRHGENLRRDSAVKPKERRCVRPYNGICRGTWLGPQSSLARLSLECHCAGKASQHCLTRINRFI